MRMLAQFDASSILSSCCILFLFKQRTAYEMRMSDWSSDVCSSDLFPGWTLPGVTGAGGLQALIKGGTPVAGQRMVVAGSGPLLWAAAATAQARGAHILAIVEQAPTQAIARFAGGLAHTPAKLAQALRLRFGLWKTPYWHGAHVTAVHGEKQVTGITVRRRGADINIA